MNKKLLLGASIALLGVSLASCGQKEVRNTQTPTGSLNLEAKVASAMNDKFQMNTQQYYNRLRALGFSKVTNEIDSIIYKDELATINALYNGDFNTARAGYEFKNSKGEMLYADKDGNVTDEMLKKLQMELLEQINTVIATKIYGTHDYEAIASKSTKDLNKSVKSFINSQQKANNSTITEAMVTTYLTPKDDNYSLPSYSKSIEFSKETLNSLPSAVNAVLLEQAKLLSSQKGLFYEAHEEFVDKTVENDKGEEETKRVKNDFYLIKDTSIENQYDSTYKTYGTYNAIILTFNSLTEANTALAHIGGAIDTTNPEKSYIDLYKYYYRFHFTEDDFNNVTKEHENFIFEVDKHNDDFTKVPTAVASLVKDTLEDNEYLTEPRNVNNKYVLAYRLKTEYKPYEEASFDSEVEYKDLGDKKESVDREIKRDIIKSNASNYQSTDYEKKLKALNDNEDTKLKIYDPYFEYKYEYANPSFYEHIDSKEFAGNEGNIFTLAGKTYTVEEFFEDASSEYSSQIITEHFQLEYANLYYDDFVKMQLISENAKKDNDKALKDALKQFNDGKNATYPKEIGSEAFLLGTYGYTNEDDVLKYYFNSKAALSQYKSILVFDEWSKEGSDGKFVINSEEMNILNNILETGNKGYEDLFSINLDHILINIDDNGDGQPDDPNIFIAKLSEKEKASFNAAIEALAKQIYTESTHPGYADTKLYDRLLFIKSQYEENAELKFPTAEYTTWADFKSFPFLLTVEQLASSGDITQESVNNFVPEFKEYVENIFKTAKKSADKEYENGIFYAYNNTTATGAPVDSADDISMDTLCKTSFGYHMLILNSYELPDSPLFKPEDDYGQFQKDLTITLRKYDFEDDSKDYSVVVNTDSYNKDNDKGASLNQLFIYYVESANGNDSQLDTDIKTLMTSLFDGAINTYSSANFQTFVLLNYLNINIEMDALKLSVNTVSKEIENLQNLVKNYDNESPYASWVDLANPMDWSRPNQK